MKKIAVILLAFCWSCLTFSADYLDRAAFADKYVAFIKQTYPELTVVTVNESEIRLVSDDKEEITAFLDNAYAQYRNNPSELAAVLDQYTSGVLMSYKLSKDDLDKTSIFPVIKDQHYIQQVEARFAESGQKGLVYEPLNNSLFVLYAFDTPQAIRFMTERDLTEMKLDKSELRVLAKANLKKALPGFRLEGDPSSIAMLVADGTYEASAILYDELWVKENFPVKGNIVVFIPTRDLVLVTGTQDKVSLAKIDDLLQKNAQNWPHMISMHGFERVGASWQEFRP